LKYNYFRKDETMEQPKIAADQANSENIAGSLTSCPLTIVSAVRFADTILGPQRNWDPANEIQKMFINDYLKPYGDVPASLKEIESIAAYEAAIINEFLRRKGFSIQLDDFSPNEFGVASVLDLFAEWIHEGDEAIVFTPDQRQFPGVDIDKRGVKLFYTSDHAHPVACLQTKSQDIVFMTMLEKPPVDIFGLFNLAAKFSENLRNCDDFEGVRFPMVDLRQRVDISWLLGMSTYDAKGDPWSISQALQENRLRMNEIGARAQSAVALKIRCAGFLKPPHNINKPFLIWFMRPGLPIPLFVGYITEADWKNPGDLKAL
jgi:hypothetical protein